MKLDHGSIVKSLIAWEKPYIRRMRIYASANTVKSYSYVVSKLIEFARGYDNDIGISEVNRMFIESFFDYCEETFERGQRLSTSTKQQHLKALKSFLLYITENNDDLVDLVKSVEKIKFRTKRTPREHLNKEELEELLFVLDEMKDKQKPGTYINSLAVRLGVFAGLRASEILAFTLGSLMELGEGSYAIRVKGKGGHVDDVRIPYAKVRKEIEYFRGIGKSPDEPIMVTGNGHCIDAAGLYRRLNTLYVRAGIKKRGVHLLRHTYAMNLIVTTDIRTTQKMLRHLSIQATSMYLSATDESVKEAVEKL